MDKILFCAKNNLLLRLIIKYCFFILGVILFFSCEKKERTELTFEEKVLYDSLKSQAFKDIRSKTDAICEGISDSLFAAYTDSIFEVRMSEVKQLFEE